MTSRNNKTHMPDEAEKQAILKILDERVFNRKEPAKMVSQEEMNEYLKKRGILNG